MNFHPWQWAVMLTTTFVAALLQGTIGFGYAVLSVPVLSLIDPRLAPVPQILTALPMTLFAAGREWAHLDVKGATWILVGRLPGAAIGAALLAVATQRALDLLIGAIVLGAVLILATPLKLRRSPSMDFGVGAFATTTGYVSAIGGPPLALLLRDEHGPRLRSTLGLVFAVGIVVTLAVRTATQQITWLDVALGAALTPVALFGMLASRWLHDRVEGNALRHGVLVTSAFAALGLIGRALFAPITP
ncbi:MAG TPA: sulfite exporter TauE/SafE family protein [Polyangiaceae bacterium]|jgi:uncharacterized membrane protein YfcA